MKKMISIFIVFIVFGLTTAVFAQHDVVTRTLELEKGGTVKVEVNPGDITIKTWDKNEVLVKVDGLDDDEVRELEIRSKGNLLTIEYEGKWGYGNSADYTITVPTNVNLELYTTGGDVRLYNNISGDVKVSTMGGDISTESISGDAKLETMGGNISFKNIGGRASITTQGGDLRGNDISGSSTEVKTMGGDIQLNKINDVQKITTFGGNIFVKEANGDVELTTFGGQIELDKAQNSVTAKTYGGNISIGQANGRVDVNTGAGNIELRQISGSVKARTSAGDIYVGLNPSGNVESEIRTDAGDIVLTLPGNTKAEIEAKSIAAGWARDNGHTIRSDFDGDIRDRRGDVLGNFKINGGGNYIYLKTTSGDIQIKKKN